MNHFYKISAGFILTALVLIGFQNCGESIDYSAYDGSTNSSSVTSGIPANITALQSSYNRTVGQSLIITANVEGTDVSLSWFKNGTLIPGENTNTLTLNNLQVSDAGDYKLRAQTLNPTVVSERTTVVSVSAAPTATPSPTPANLPPAPQITSQPSSVTMAYFGPNPNPEFFYQYANNAFVFDANSQFITDVTMAVTATGTGLTYQWQHKPVGQTWRIISATNRIHKFTMTSMTQAGQYRVQVTDSYNRTAVSNAATVSTYEFIIDIGPIGPIGPITF